MNHDRQITITVGKSRKATQWEQRQLSAADLYQLFATPRRSSETQADYMAMTKAQQDDLKDVGGFVGGSLNGPRRKKENVTGRDIITLDFDNIPAGLTEAVIGKVDALGCGYCIFSTRKHSPATPRLRVVIPFNRTTTPDEYMPLARLMAAQIGMAWVDPTTFDVSRMMYFPSCSADGEYIFRVGDKPLLPVDLWLTTHTQYLGDWRNPANWAKAPNATEDYIRTQAKKQADPIEKNGIVGAFCKVYDVHKAIAELIPGVYIPVDTDDGRYTLLVALQRAVLLCMMTVNSCSHTTPQTLVAGGWSTPLTLCGSINSASRIPWGRRYPVHPRCEQQGVYSGGGSHYEPRLQIRLHDRFSGKAGTV